MKLTLSLELANPMFADGRMFVDVPQITTVLFAGNAPVSVA